MAKNDIVEEKSKGRLIFRGIIYFIMVILLCFLTIIFINVTLSSSDGTPPQLGGFRFFTTTKNNTNDKIYAILSKDSDITHYAIGEDVVYKNVSSLTRKPVIASKKIVGVLNIDDRLIFQLSNSSEYVEIDQANIMGKVIFANAMLGELMEFMKKPVGLIVCFAFPLIILIIFEMIALSVTSKKNKLNLEKTNLILENISDNDQDINTRAYELKQMHQYNFPNKGLFSNNIDVEEVDLVLKQDYKTDDITQEFPIPTEDDHLKLENDESLYKFPTITPFEIQKEEITIGNNLKDDFSYNESNNTFANDNLSSGKVSLSAEIKNENFADKQKEEITIGNNLKDDFNCNEPNNTFANDNLSSDKGDLSAEIKNENFADKSKEEINPVKLNLLSNDSINNKDSDIINIDDEIDDIINHVINEIDNANNIPVNDDNTHQEDYEEQTFNENDELLDDIFDFSSKLALDNKED